MINRKEEFDYLDELKGLADELASILDKTTNSDIDLDFDHPVYGENLREVRDKTELIAAKYNDTLEEAWSYLVDISAIISVDCLLNDLSKK